MGWKFPAQAYEGLFSFLTWIDDNIESLENTFFLNGIIKFYY